MAKASKVKMKIVEIAGGCPNGHQVGEEYLVDSFTPAGICLGSFGACLPYLTALRYGYDARRRNGYHSLEKTWVHIPTIEFDDYIIEKA